MAAWIVWGFASLYVFLGEALKSYLLQFRYRDLKKDTSEERSRMSFLFSIVDDPSKYRWIFSNTLSSVSVAFSGAAWVYLILLYVNLLTEGLSDWVGYILLFVLLLISAIFHGLFLKWLPIRLGPRFIRPVLQTAIIYIVTLSFVFRPIRFGVLQGIRIMKSLGVKDLEVPEPIDRDLQILATGREDVRITKITEKIASRALELSSLSVYDILLPRNQVQLFDLNEPVALNIERARKTGHTRFPLCSGDLDHCEGLIHIKDIFRARKAIEDLDFSKLARPILRVKEDEPLDKTLQVLMTKRVHMALVEDEFGGIVGVLTMERILEELVGEIQDEFDKEEKMVVSLKTDFYKISGLTPLHEVEAQLGLDNLEDDDVSSFGGLISHHLGRIPAKGEQVEIGPLLITIKETDETRIISTNVRVLSLPDADF